MCNPKPVEEIVKECGKASDIPVTVKHKKKTLLSISGIAVLAILFSGIYIFLSQSDGTTIESREDLISKSMNGQVCNISTETEIDGYIVSATRHEYK